MSCRFSLQKKKLRQEKTILWFCARIGVAFNMFCRRREVENTYMYIHMVVRASGETGDAARLQKKNIIHIMIRGANLRYGS